MKVKSLLLAAAAMVALGASAQSITVGNIEVNDENVGQLIEVPFTLNMPDGDNFTNIQFHIVFPQGVKPYYDEENECYGYAGSGIKKKAGAPVVSFSDNFAKEEYYPEHDVIGANTTKTPNTTNPNEFYVLNVVCDKKAAGQIKLWCKYVREDDTAYAFGTAVAGDEPGTVVYTELYTPEGGEVINTTTPDPGSAVNDINSAKAVTSVKYYNAAGMASDTAFDGINIVVTKYADGSQSTAKVVK